MYRAYILSEMTEIFAEKNIGIFCSANDLPQKYTRPAEELAKLIARNGYGLVWGGSNHGLMKLIATAAQEEGGRLIGVSVKHLEHIAREDADEMYITDDPGERKKTFLSRADAIVALVGGIGTFDEITDVLENKKHGLYKGILVVLDSEGFWDGFKVQMERMKSDGFINQSLDELIFFAQTPQEVMDYIEVGLG